MRDSPQAIQRSVLPMPGRVEPGLTTYDAKDPETKYPPIEPLRPPEGAPNILVVLLDDVGFGASSAFGGPVDTPTAVDLSSGEPSDPAVRADLTVTFHRPKTGLRTKMGRALAGRVLVAPIGIPPAADRG